jgi:hypothetical protein
MQSLNYKKINEIKTYTFFYIIISLESHSKDILNS